MRLSVIPARTALLRAAVLLTASAVFSAAAAGQTYPTRCGTGIPASEQTGYVPLPRGDVFCPLVADPKSPRSFASYLHERSDSAGRTSTIRMASVGIGDVFSLGRWNGARPGDGVQLALSAGVFAQFDLGTSSYELLNADYVIGIPLTIRRGWYSTRVRIYHQSSHLGDEYLLREPTSRRDRENLSFEAIEWILSADGGPFRVYGGGEVLFDRSPDDLERYVGHAGFEVRPWARVIPLGTLGGFRFVGGTDLKASQEHHWNPSVSVRAGLEYDRAGMSDPQGRRWGIFFQWYDGPSPYGQFFRDDVRHIGVGLHFGGI
jgi:hypothetical protein